MKGQNEATIHLKLLLQNWYTLLFFLLSSTLQDKQCCWLLFSFPFALMHVSLTLKPLNVLRLLSLSLYSGTLAESITANSTLLRCSDQPDSCVRPTTTSTVNEAWLRPGCGNGKNNELLQGYLCASPCHECVNSSANLIRRDKLFKMFSDFPLSPILLCPQIDFKSVRWIEMTGVL